MAKPLRFGRAGCSVGREYCQKTACLEPVTPFASCSGCDMSTSLVQQDDLDASLHDLGDRGLQLRSLVGVRARNDFEGIQSSGSAGLGTAVILHGLQRTQTGGLVRVCAVEHRAEADCMQAE